jgi:hypothetical protein
VEFTASRLQGVVRCIRGGLAQLNSVIARLDHGRPDLVSARGEQHIAMIDGFNSQPADENSGIGKSPPQPLAKVSCLGQPAGRQRDDANERRAFLGNLIDNLGSQRLIREDLHFVTGGRE